MAARSRSLPPLLPYGNRHGNSGVLAYAIERDAVHVVFVGKRNRYVYTSASTGPDRLERMKRLASEGKGLSSFVSRQVRGGYADTVPLAPDEIARWYQD